MTAAAAPTPAGRRWLQVRRPAAMLPQSRLDSLASSWLHAGDVGGARCPERGDFHVGGEVPGAAHSYKVYRPARRPQPYGFGPALLAAACCAMMRAAPTTGHI